MSTALHLRGRVLPGGEERDLWLADGRISTEPVAEAHTILDGGYVLPGLVDAHCHVGLGPDGGVELTDAVEQAETERDAGTLLLRDCGVPIDTRPLQQRADLPRIVRAGRHLARPKRYLRNYGIELEDPERLPEYVAEQARYGDGWVKLVGDWIDRSIGDLSPLWSDRVLAEAIEVAHEHGAHVTAHVFGESALPGLIDAGIDCIEHGTGLTSDIIDEMGRRGTALVPTLINIATFPEIAAGATKYPEYARHMTRLYEGSDDMVATAIDAGVPVFAGTDAGGGIKHGRIAEEVAALNRAGLSGDGAVGAASWIAREWLGYPGIEHGAPADLVCYASDPRTDPAVLAQPSLIVLRGVVMS